MTIKLYCDKANPPLGALLAASLANSSKNNAVKVEWGQKNSIVLNSSSEILCETSQELLRKIAQTFKELKLCGVSPLERTQIDHWLCYTFGPLANKNEFSSALSNINKILGPISYFVGNHISIADLAVFASLFANKQWQALYSKRAAPNNVLRWYRFIESQDFVKTEISKLTTPILDALTKGTEAANNDKEQLTAGGRAREGKFVELPGAEMGKVVVRFPPEASGYLHIGHAKAALLNQYYQQAFDGKLIMRFDDTNPAKENTHFEEVILEDVAMLEIKPDIFTYTSDYFELMLKYCEKMLKDGTAYVDDTDPEVMKQEREQKVESANRSNAIEKNFKMWEEMKKGTEYGQKCCVRAKIDMKSLNGCLRDPTIYRCKNETHPRTGTKYRVYPTYDFACPIVDAIEGVTHTLRTMEYHDRDPQFYWFIECLGLRKPYIWEYSRLSMTNTVLSKRKLTWFVDQGLVDGWDDPRMPTVRGVLRRGMTVEGLKEFIIAQGSSRSVVFMEWDKIWAFNKKVIDPIAPRYTVVDYDTHVPVIVKGVEEQCLSVPKHPKNPDVGLKSVWVGPRLLVDKADAERLKEGENATFIHWGNLLIKKINKKDGKIESVEAEPNLDNKDYKKTLKLTFLCDTPKAKLTHTFFVFFDHIISKPLLGKDEDFKQFIGHETRKDLQVIGDPELKNLKEGDIIQIQRRGFFRVDVPYGERSPFTCKEQPIILFHIPDGSTKDNPFSALNDKQDKPIKKENQQVSGSESSPLKAPVQNTGDSVNEIDLTSRINEVGNTVRGLKSKKASKEEITKEVKILLDLKAEYKKLTGTDFPPGGTQSKTTGSESSPLNAPSVNSVNDLTLRINEVGNKVRDMKSKKASKEEITKGVKILLDLKAEYKKLTGTDFPPGGTQSKTTGSESSPLNAPSVNSVNDLTLRINEVGNKVRDLKSKKASKEEITKEVKILLDLKAEYKKLTGTDFPPGGTQSKTTGSESSPLNAPSVNSVNDLTLRINEVGNRVRDLKSKKASKEEVTKEVKILLDLKAEYKKLTGTEFPPGGKQNSKPVKTSSDQNVPKPKQEPKKSISASESSPLKAPLQNTGDSVNEIDLTSRINEVGNTVRDLKSKKASKEEINKEVKTLLDLKAEYKKLTGKEFPPGGKPNNKPPKTTSDQKVAKPKQEPKEKKESSPDEKRVVKKQTRLGLEAKKEEDLPNWYSQVLTKSQMIEYYDVSGCYIYRPWSYKIWEAIKNWLDKEIEMLGVENCYFPIFVTKAMLEKEKTHIADFSPEVAWVTKAGDSDMSVPVAVRPTSETGMYPAYAKWIQSYKDLPLKLNQWNNVVRWEFKHAQPFLRTREFMWQEGHTAFSSSEEAKEEVSVILDLYARVYNELLAVPVIKGRKTEKEKFAGGDYTYTVEAYIPASGRAIQGATSHNLGQNFSKMFEITFEDPETHEMKYVYQNSWGITTRTIGVMVMIHADNQGLVLPPNVASIQAIIVPCGITTSLSEEGRANLQSTCTSLETQLRAANIRVEGDYREDNSPGWKFNHWELKGVPIRIELGPKDIEKKQLVAVRRDTGEKVIIPMENAVNEIEKLLKTIQNALYSKANEEFQNHVITFKNWSDFVPNLENKNLNLVPFCGSEECEDNIKTDSTRDDGATDTAAPSSGAKSLCIPLEQPAKLEDSDKCIHPSCRRKPQYYTLFGRSY